MSLDFGETILVILDAIGDSFLVFPYSLEFFHRFTGLRIELIFGGEMLDILFGGEVFGFFVDIVENCLKGFIEIASRCHAFI